MRTALLAIALTCEATASAIIGSNNSGLPVTAPGGIVFTNLYAASFNGTTSKVTFGKPAALSTLFDGSNAWTISMRLRPSAVADRFIVGNNEGASGASGAYRGLLVQHRNISGWEIGLISNYPSAAIYLTGGTSMSINTTYRFTLAYGGTKVASDVVARLNHSTMSLTTSINTLTGASMASTTDWSYGLENVNIATTTGWSGVIDEVAVFNKKLSNAEENELDVGGLVSGGASDLRATSVAGNLVLWHRDGDGSDTTTTINDVVGTATGTGSNLSIVAAP